MSSLLELLVQGAMNQEQGSYQEMERPFTEGFFCERFREILLKLDQSGDNGDERSLESPVKRQSNVALSLKPRSANKVLPFCCQDFLHSLQGQFSQYSVDTTRKMLASVANGLADTFGIDSAELTPADFRSKISFQYCKAYITHSTRKKYLRPMAKRFYTYLYVKDVGLGGLWAPALSVVLREISLIGGRSSNAPSTSSQAQPKHPLVEEFIAHRLCRQGSKKEGYICDRLLRWLCTKDQLTFGLDPLSLNLKLVTANNLEDFSMHLKDEGLKDSSIATHVRSLKRWFRHLEKTGAIPASPMSYVVYSARSDRRPKTITVDQLIRFLECVIRYSPQVVCDIAAFLVQASLGLRPSELVRLTVGSVDPETGAVTFFRAKSKREARLYLDSRILVFVQRHLATLPTENPNQPLWLDILGYPLNYGIWRRRFAYYRQLAGIDSSVGGPHAFRHTLISMLVSENKDLNLIMELAGHTDVRHIDPYVHAAQGSMAKAAAALEKAHWKEDH